MDSNRLPEFCDVEKELSGIPQEAELAQQRQRLYTLAEDSPLIVDPPRRITSGGFCLCGSRLPIKVWHCTCGRNWK